MAWAWQIVKASVCGWDEFLRALHGACGNLRGLLHISQKPECPTQVAQCGCANILAILVLQLGVTLRVIQSSGLFQMRQRGGELPFGQMSGAHDAMCNTHGRGIAEAFGLCKELRGSARLLNDLTSDVVACPHPIQDGQLHCGIG